MPETMKTKKPESETLARSDNGACELAEPVTASVPAVKPQHKIRRNGDDWEASLEMPGVKRDDVEVSFEDGVLEVKAHRSDSVPESWRPLNYVPSARDYRLQLRLSDAIDVDKITAKMEDGILYLRFPASDSAKPRTIKVK